MPGYSANLHIIGSETARILKTALRKKLKLQKQISVQKWQTAALRKSQNIGGITKPRKQCFPVLPAKRITLILVFFFN